MTDRAKDIPGERKEERRREHLEELIDEALEESFPASDPPSIAVPSPSSACLSRESASFSSFECKPVTSLIRRISDLDRKCPGR